MRYRKWTDSDLVEAVKSSTNKGEVLKKLGLKSKNSGNYQTIDRHIRLLNLDTSHFMSAILAIPPVRTYSFEEVLIENSTYSSTKNLKRKLLKGGLLKNQCYGEGCGISDWLGKKLQLQLDHINGNRSDNRIENLRLLCPNCHSQTSTFAGKNKGKI
jgi:hypothetical protein